ncbi:MAG: hypothetical protein Q9157_001400 [Trypethelium eluteriae]
MYLSTPLVVTLLVGASCASTSFGYASHTDTLVQRGNVLIPAGARVSNNDPHGYEIVFDGLHFSPSDWLEGVISKDGTPENARADQYYTELESVSDSERINMALYSFQAAADLVDYGKCPVQRNGRQLLNAEYSGKITAYILKVASGFAGGFGANIAFGLGTNTTTATQDAITAGTTVAIITLIHLGVDDLLAAERLSSTDALIYTVAGQVFKAIVQAAISLASAVCPSQDEINQATTALSEIEMANIGLVSSESVQALLDQA